VSVGSLLRREGRASDAGPDGTEPGENEGTRGSARSAAVRGATIVAGTALVAGSAFGGAVLVETFFLDPAPTAGAAPAATPSEDVPAATPGALVDRASAGPDAGTGAPTAWTEVAFPTAAKAVAGGRSAAAPVTAPPSAAPTARSTPAASAAEEKQSDQEETTKKESSKKESAATPTASASTAGSTSDQTASSSGDTAKKGTGPVSTLLHAVTGVLGLGG
jgi:hypothetical protein